MYKRSVVKNLLFLQLIFNKNSNVTFIEPGSLSPDSKHTYYVCVYLSDISDHFPKEGIVCCHSLGTVGEGLIISSPS